MGNLACLDFTALMILATLNFCKRTTRNKNMGKAQPELKHSFWLSLSIAASVIFSISGLSLQPYIVQDDARQHVFLDAAFS